MHRRPLQPSNDSNLEKTNATQSRAQAANPDEPPDEGWLTVDVDSPDDIDDLDEIDLSDERWEAFLADEDELDPEPDPDDFYLFDL
ncbi:MAG: hypothetical protein U0805_14130 [Pirellulales bacterium]